MFRPQPAGGSFDHVNFCTFYVDFYQSASSAAARLLGKVPLSSGVERGDPKSNHFPDKCLLYNDIHTTVGLASQARLKLTAVLSRRLESENVRRTLQTSERRRAPKGKIAVVCANVQHGIDALQHTSQPIVQLMLIEPENLS